MKKTILGTLILLAAATSLSAGWVIYTDQSLWNAAVAARTTLVMTENFDDQVVEPWLSITSDYPGSIGSGRWNSRVRSMSQPLLNDTFSFTVPGLAFGADFDLGNPGGPGEGANVFADLGGVSTLIGGLDRSLVGFWGFVIDDNAYFSYVRLEGGGNELGSQETYALDNLSVAAIPEPSTVVLAAAGLLLLALRRRKK